MPPSPATSAEPVPPPRGSPAEVFAASLRLGLTSFGGPIAHIGYFRREYVERRRWLDDRHFADLLALCQALPGPASSQLGIAIGTMRAGRLGGIASWLGFTLPSAAILVAFALITGGVDIADSGWVRGLKLAAVAVVAQAVLVMWRSLAPDAARSMLVIAAAAVALVAPSPVTQVGVIVAGAVAGWTGAVGRAMTDGARERLTAMRFANRSAIGFLGVFALLLVALPVLRETSGSMAVALADAFYRTGSLVFGGGHVVLPLLDQAVVDPGWVNEDRFLAGYGAAQAVPGPLFTFAAFLGASMRPEPGGIPGAGLALVAIFLPSFLLVWGVLPIWDALRARPGVQRALRGVNAAVVGILLAALVTPVWTGAVATPVDAFVAVAAAVVLVVARLPPIAVVLGTAVAVEVLARVA